MSSKYVNGSLAILFSLSLLCPLGTSQAATNSSGVTDAAKRMVNFQLLKGVDPTGDLALNDDMTRAQLVTVIVRAFGQESNAKYLNGAAAFSDTANHPWASGYIAMAKQIIDRRSGGRETIGSPNGTFNPDGKVTQAEAVAFLMKFLGGHSDPTLAWPDNYIQGAINAGLITAEDSTILTGNLNAPTTRGLAFYLLDRAFYSYILDNGKTLYTSYVDTTPPQLSIDPVPSQTTALKLTITGTVSEDVTAVTTGSSSNPATLANGKFTASIDLLPSQENNVRIVAVDRAGNSAEQTVKVTHVYPAPIPPALIPNRIEADSTALMDLKVGQSKTITFTVYDQHGKPVRGAKLNFDVTGSLKQQGLNVLTAQTSTDGMAALTYTGEEIRENGTITASVAGTNVTTQTGTIRVVGEPAYVLASPGPEETTQLLPSQSMIVTFLVMDSAEQPLRGVQLDLTVSEGLFIEDLSETTITTNEKGIATVTYTNNHMLQSGTIQAIVSGTTISDSTGPIVSVIESDGQ